MMLEKVLKQFWERKFNLLVLCFILLHFLYLGSFPAGFNHDEIEKIASISSYINAGTDISGVPFPKFLISTRTQGGQNNFPVLLLSFIFRFIQLNQLTARIPMVILNIGTSLLLARIVRLLTPKESLYRYVFFIAILNPWMWFLSRNITEAPFTLFFVLLGVYLLEQHSRRQAILSAFSFIAALLSYWGTLIIVPILFISSLLIRQVNSVSHNYKKLISPVFLFCIGILIFGTALFVIKDSTFYTRSGELIYQNINRYQPMVDKIRRESVTNPLTPLFANKYMLLFNDFTARYINVYSPDFLFIKGDPRATYQYGSHGMFFIIDFPFILIGLVSLAKYTKTSKKRRLLLYLVVFAILGPLASALNIVENSYVFRSVLILPVLLILSALGLQKIFNFSKKVGMMVGIVYLFSFANFLNFYLYQYPVSHQENQFWSEEVLTSYVSRITTDLPVTVVTAYPIQVSEKYVFYQNNPFTKEIAKIVYSNDINFDSVHFTSNCPTDWRGTVVIQDGMHCSAPTKMSALIIENYSDSGSLWKIYNDTLCTETSLSSFRGDHQITDYRLYNENNKTFCLRQIHKYE